MAEFKGVVDSDSDMERTDMFKMVRENVVGKDAIFTGPFGDRKVIYCDYTASGKPLEFIENYINEYVQPFYANTHTTTSVSALQTTRFRENARDIIKECINASDEDVVIFCGNGVTAAVHKSIHALELSGEKAANTVVLVGPYEHHSNILPWKETGSTVERIKDAEGGNIDMKDLEDKLKTHFRAGRNLIVAMSAASNITGIITDTDAVSEMAHKYGALTLWDYATAAPYIKMDMNSPGLKYKDAIFCSPHKFVGGVGTPGVLIAKKKLFQNPIPGDAGGGTVVYVTQQTHEYHSNIEDREEGGTPAIIESIRAGLVFQLKNAIGEDVIEQKEEEFCKLAFQKWRQNSNIAILGSSRAHRLPIFSLLFKHPESGKYLHHNFVSVLLNDLYGIQVRGGCACAGPYAQDLLSMTEERAQEFMFFLSEADGDKQRVKLEIMKPGFARLNLPYFLDDDTADFILTAIDRVATDGWRLLPQYCFNPKTGDWYHRTAGKVHVRTLQDIDYTERGLVIRGSIKKLMKKGYVDLEMVEEQAEKTIADAKSAADKMDLTNDPRLEVSEEQRSLVWFLLPHEALVYLEYPSLKYLPIKQSEMPFKQRRNTRKATQQHFRQALLRAEKDNKTKPMTFLHRESLFGQPFHGDDGAAAKKNVTRKPDLQKISETPAEKKEPHKAATPEVPKPAQTKPKSVDPNQNEEKDTPKTTEYVETENRKVFREVPKKKGDKKKKFHEDKEKCNIL